MIHKRHPFLLVCLLPAAAPALVHADEFDAINFRAAVDVVRDDNLFRVPDGQKPQMDTISSAILGIDYRQHFSQQEVIANVTWVNYHYAANDYLDANALNYDGRWLWAVGSHLTGELSASRAEAPNSFAEVPEIRNSGQRNLRVAENQRFSLDYALHPSWHVVGDALHQSARNEQVVFASGDSETWSAGIGAKYSPASGNWIRGLVRRYDGEYTHRPFDPVSRFDNKFTQPSVEFDMNWQLTGHSILAGRLAYLHRRHEHFQDRDYSGWDGRLDYLYQYSDKTRFDVAYIHGLLPYQADDSSYFVSNGIELGSQWAATDKIAVGARLGYAYRRYQGEVKPLTAPRRVDENTIASADVAYKATRWLELKASAMMEKRNSNQANFDFSDRRVMLSANIAF